MDLLRSLFEEPGDIDTFAREVARTWRIRGQVNWRAPDFTKEKAFISGVFAKIAYLCIPTYELQAHAGEKVIPCFTWDELCKQQLQFDLRRFIVRADFDAENAFILPSAHAVAVGIPHPDVVFIALRGTRPLYLSDWRADVAAGPRQIAVNGGAGGPHAYRVHAGFFDAVDEFMQPLASWVASYVGRQSPPPPVYVVGHSLGGAMTAVLRALDGAAVSVAYGAPFAQRPRIGIHSAYTFGMPRYGDSEMVTRLPTPFHIYSLLDLVPSVPPRALGFADAADEYCFRNATLVRPRSRPLPTVPERAVQFMIVNHFMEKYVVKLGAVNGLTL
jgi:hypothetical protein